MLFLICCTSTLALGCAPVPAPAVPGVDGFERLKSLVGTWEAPTPKGALIKVAYRLVSNDSVLVQSFVTPSGKETLTVFHLDASHLLATHYCGQGNQPRLRLDPGSTADHLTFTFLDATNLAEKGVSHLVRLDLVLSGPDRYTEVETYEEDGKPDVTTLSFSRSAP